MNGADNNYSLYTGTVIGIRYLENFEKLGFLKGSSEFNKIISGTSTENYLRKKS